MCKEGGASSGVTTSEETGEAKSIDGKTPESDKFVIF